MKKVMNKFDFFKYLKKKFDFDKFYESLTNKNSLSSTYNILDELHNNLETDEHATTYNVKIKSKIHKYPFNLKDHYGFSDKNYKVAVEDGTVFNFLSRKIDCKPIFIAKKDYLPVNEMIERTLNAHFIYLFSFKGKEKKIIASMTWNTTFGWEMNIDQIIEKKINKSEINKKVVKSIKQLDFTNYNYFFIYKSLNLSTNYFAKLLKTKLKGQFVWKEDLEDMRNEAGVIDVEDFEKIRSIMVFQLNDNLKIPFITQFIWYKKQKRAHHAFHSSNVNHKIHPPYVYKLPIEKGFKGLGTYTFDDGTKYIGQRKDSKRHGQGTYTSEDGSKYVGKFKDDEYHGKGTHAYANGDRYVGKHKDGKRHGQGTYTFADGTVEKGIWENDEFIGQQ